MSSQKKETVNIYEETDYCPCLMFIEVDDIMSTSNTVYSVDKEKWNDLSERLSKAESEVLEIQSEIFALLKEAKER